MKYENILATVHFDNDTIDEQWYYDGDDFNGLLNSIREDITSGEIEYATIKISEDSELIVYSDEAQIVNTQDDEAVFAW